jgi:hypothetical protein
MQRVLHFAGGGMLGPAFEASLARRVPPVRTDDLIRGGKQLSALFFSEIVNDRFHALPSF